MKQVKQVRYKRLVLFENESLTCRSLGQIQTVGMIDLRTAGLLTRHNLPSITTVETFILSLLGDRQLTLALHSNLLLQFPCLVVRCGLILKRKLSHGV